jgi:hypothetical protein
MGYAKSRGNRPYEQAGRANHSAIINNPAVRDFVSGCELPSDAETINLKNLVVAPPATTQKLSAVIAVDGGMTETYVRERFPSASIAFLNIGPLFFNLADLQYLDECRFIAPEDMARLKNLQRYTLVIPTRAVRVKGCASFAEGVRRTIHNFLTDRDLQEAFAWLVFEMWRPDDQHKPWRLPRCPNAQCSHGEHTFISTGPREVSCPSCKRPVFLSDAMRLYERIDEEQGAGGVLSYLLTTLETVVVVHLIKQVLAMKRELLRDILFVKDGPLAFFGTTAPLYRPMRELMKYLRDQGSGRPLINLVGVEKSGPFVEHAASIESRLPPNTLLVLGDKYIYRYITPGDPSTGSFGRNTYFGAKAILRGVHSDTHVLSIPTGDHVAEPQAGDLFNVGDIAAALTKLRCSMYDNALLPVSLANRLVSLADVPSSEILAKFTKDRVK